MHYLVDFAESFMILFRDYFDVLAAGIIALGMVMAAAWATIPHIARRV
jgi:hypothetical protein